jgi:hypothetical protein
VGWGNIRANGHPNGQRWRQLVCLGRQRHFLETHGTPFHGKQVEPDKLVWAIAALAEGLGIRAVARVFETDSNTVLSWLMAAAEHLEAFWRLCFPNTRNRSKSTRSQFHHSCRLSLIMVVEPSYLGNFDDPPALRWLQSPGLWTIHREREMRAKTMVIGHIPADTHENDVWRKLGPFEADRHRCSPSRIALGHGGRSYRRWPHMRIATELALEQAYRFGEKPVTPAIVTMTLAPDMHGLEPTLTRYGYTVHGLAELLNIRPAEVRAFLHGQLPPGRTEELHRQLLAAGIPLSDRLASPTPAPPEHATG